MVHGRPNTRLPQSDGDKKRDNAVFLLPLFGSVFSLPPMMNLFNHKVLLFGIPLAFLYLLGVWTIMVIAAFFIARKNRQSAPFPEEAPSPAPAPAPVPGPGPDPGPDPTPDLRSDQDGQS